SGPARAACHREPGGRPRRDRRRGQPRHARRAGAPHRDPGEPVRNLHGTRAGRRQGHGPAGGARPPAAGQGGRPVAAHGRGARRGAALQRPPVRSRAGRDCALWFAPGAGTTVRLPAVDPVRRARAAGGSTGARRRGRAGHGRQRRARRASPFRRMTMHSEPGRIRRSGVFLLPNLLTTAALFAGFYSIVAAVDGNFQTAGVAIFVAMVLDALDGRVARLTRTSSQFGKEYDSLADMVSFGVAPAIVVYQWGVARLTEWNVAWGRVGRLVAFLFAVAAALRLARFNARAPTADRRFFTGLPSPSA